MCSSLVGLPRKNRRAISASVSQYGYATSIRNFSVSLICPDPPHGASPAGSFPFGAP